MISDDVEKLLERLKEVHDYLRASDQDDYAEYVDDAIPALRSLLAENDELNRIKNELLGDCHTYVIENAKLRDRSEKAEAALADITRGADKIMERAEKAEAEVERLNWLTGAARREAVRKATEIARLREALGSIARNTCCDKCQEAALVARSALGPLGNKTSGEHRGN